MIKNNQNKFNNLRSNYSKFVYEGFNIKDIGNSLTVAYHFNLDDQHFFKPTLTISSKSHIKSHLDADILENFIFQIGMVELISYWKAACPQEVIIKPSRLEPEQVEFWKKLYFNGLGEFFYLNGIKTDIDSFMQLRSNTDSSYSRQVLHTNMNRVVVPIGGGKDSAVTIELLKDHFEVIPFIVNPRNASLETALNAGFSQTDIFEVKRTIDPQLLELNSQGFLNGHTPFSALLAFTTILAGALANAHYIALSNESSANEPTVKDGANHQYSKSIEFETDFRSYVQKYVTGNLEYFSFLRPLNEWGIARLFSRMKSYHPVFKSCNVGSKTDEWCGKCPKCLFTFIMLSPFLQPSELVKIFGKNLFEDAELIPVLKELSGEAGVKPFECVGTVDEVNTALKMSLEKYPEPLPPLLKYYQAVSRLSYTDDKEVLSAFDTQHFLEPPFFNILKAAIHD